MYSKKIEAIKKSNRHRTRKIFSNNLIDLASNDYLGLSQNKKLFKKAYKRVLKEQYHSPKASMLVNGYNAIHKDFEETLCKVNNFETGVVVGSGFLANISIIESLVRRDNILFIDEDYHASGILASKLVQGKTIFFKHNDPVDLKEKIKLVTTNTKFLIAIEGIYSMHGDIAHKEIFNIADEHNALLIVDEAHSSGVIGENLLGIFDYYNIKPKENHIKMGTLGKAYGSYGAYILAKNEIIDFLINRAKPIIYSTAPSLFDTALGLESLKFILKNKKELIEKIKNNQQIINNILNIKSKSLIVPITIGNNRKVMQIQENLKNEGFLIGAIRQPTVKSAIIRLIAKIDIHPKKLQKICKLIKKQL